MTNSTPFTRAQAKLGLCLALLGASVLADLPASAQSQRSIVEQSSEDRYFVINGVAFEARTRCRRISVGDEVQFLTGSASGRCTFASFLDLNSGENCEVRCVEGDRNSKQ